MESTTFPNVPADTAANWVASRINASFNVARYTGVVASGTAAVKFSAQNMLKGYTLTLTSPVISTTGLTATSKLFYSIASIKGNNSTADTLRIQSSSDCGLTWTTRWTLTATSTPSLYSRSGSTLSAYTPVAADWRYDSLIIPAAMRSGAKFQLRFTYISGGTACRSLYLDRIAIADNATALALPSEFNTVNNLNFFPNPSTESSRISFSVLSAGVHKVTLVDQVGRTIAERQLTDLAEGTQSLALSDLTSETLHSGVYFVRMSSPQGTSNIRFVVAK
jgi:hypothetical protein